MRTFPFKQPSGAERGRDRWTSPPRGLRRRARSRRGATAVLGMVLTTALVVLMAFSLDMGYIGVARSELKRSADAAAIAGCWELYDGLVAKNSSAALEAAVAETASEIAWLNPIGDQSPTLSLSDNGVQLGHYDAATPGLFDTSDPTRFNAVRVHLRKNASVNGEVPLFFGKLTGRDGQSLQTVATAAMLQTISGFRSPPNAASNLQLLPFALDLETWEAVLAEATEDVWSFSNGQVVPGSDGHFECNLFPQGTGSPGNRGTVDIGPSNNSTADLVRQIIHGISASDFAALGKPLEFDENGELTLNGNTGISAAVKDPLAQIVGQTRIIPIFSKVEGNGNTAMYTIVRFEGVRILGVKLTGPMKKKHLTVQPAPMVARNSIVATPGTVSSSYLYSPVMLVQ